MSKIEIEVSDKNECTRAPYWIIVEPFTVQNDSNEDEETRVGALAAQSHIYGLFFSREEAEKYLNSTRYNFHPKAFVFCKSGYHGRQYDMACDEAMIGHAINPGAS